MSLFFSHFFPGNPVCNEKITAVGYAVDLAAAASHAASTVCPLLNLSHPHLFGFRNHIMTLSSTKNMALRFESILPSGTNIARVSACGGDAPDVAC
jgi:hypothetical protein